MVDSLEISEQTLVTMVQHYLSSAMFQQGRAPKVVSVKFTSKKTFRVGLEPIQPGAAPAPVTYQSQPPRQNPDAAELARLKDLARAQYLAELEASQEGNPDDDS